MSGACNCCDGNDAIRKRRNVYQLLGVGGGKCLWRSNANVLSDTCRFFVNYAVAVCCVLANYARWFIFVAFVRTKCDSMVRRNRRQTFRDLSGKRKTAVFLPFFPCGVPRNGKRHEGVSMERKTPRGWGQDQNGTGHGMDASAKSKTTITRMLLSSSFLRRFSARLFTITFYDIYDGLISDCY